MQRNYGVTEVLFIGTILHDDICNNFFVSGQKGRQIIIVWVQILKCFGRLTLLLRHRERILSCPPIPPLNRAQSKCSDKSVPDETSSINNVAFSLKRSGRVIRKVGGGKCVYYFFVGFEPS